MRIMEAIDTWASALQINICSGRAGAGAERFGCSIGGDGTARKATPMI